MSSTARQIVLVATLLATILGLFMAAETGQRRLEEVTRRAEEAGARERALSEVLHLLSQAESSQRGYILLADPAYLGPYRESEVKIPQALGRLHAAFVRADGSVPAEVEQLERLSNAKLVEMSETLRINDKYGRDAAVQLIRTDIGKWAMAQLSDRARLIAAAEVATVLDASQSWHNDRWTSLALTITALVASIILVLLLMRLVMRYVRTKERQAENLAERGMALERLVARRTDELSELSTHLQSLAEEEKAALSRELHDELGGLLVAARIDVSWIEQQTASTDPQIQAHFRRVQDALQSGVDLKRRVMENLRPTLLDNLGLFAALRWHVSDTCGRAGLQYVEHYPEEELALKPEASIGIFRIVQEAITNVVKHARARNVDISIATQDRWLVIRIQDDGVGLAESPNEPPRSHGLAAMRHRAVALGGSLRIMRRPDRGTEVGALLPLERVLVSSSAGVTREAPLEFGTAGQARSSAKP